LSGWHADIRNATPDLAIEWRMICPSRLEVRGMPLHPAENRGYRELFLTAEEARIRLNRLAEHLEGEARSVVEKAEAALSELVAELTPALARYDLHAELAARGGGGRIGMVRAAILDRFLERNQALRFAVDDLEHVTTLLAYLAGISDKRRAKVLGELCRTWERKMRRQVSAVRKAAVELATDPDGAIEPLDPSPVGQAAHGAAVAFGTAGEAIDRTYAETKTAVAEKSAEVKKRGFFRRG